MHTTTLNADEERREEIRQRDKAIRDYKNDMAVARDEGRAEGLAAGRAEGEVIGEAKGILKALTELVKKGLLTMVQAAAEAGMSLAEFEEKTGLKA